MTFPIFPPNRIDMTVDGKPFSPRVQKYLEELADVIAELKGLTEDTEIVEIALIQSVLLEALGLHSDPLTMQALAQIKALQDEATDRDHQIADLQGSIEQLRPQAMNQDATLAAIQDADDDTSLRSRMANLEKRVRDNLENIGALGARSW